MHASLAKRKQQMSIAFPNSSTKHFLSFCRAPCTESVCEEQSVCVTNRRAMGTAGRKKFKSKRPNPSPPKREDCRLKKQWETRTLWWTCWHRWQKLRGENSVIGEPRKPLGGGGLEGWTTCGRQGRILQEAREALVKAYSFDAYSAGEERQMVVRGRERWFPRIPECPRAVSAGTDKERQSWDRRIQACWEDESGNGLWDVLDGKKMAGIERGYCRNCGRKWQVLRRTRGCGGEETMLREMSKGRSIKLWGASRNWGRRRRWV